MTPEEIKAAVIAGHTVHYSSSAYVVKHDVFPSGREQWLIWCAAANSGIGLIDGEGKLNGDAEKFYIVSQAQLDKRATLISKLRAVGFTEEHEFPGEYTALIDPNSLGIVRVYLSCDMWIKRGADYETLTPEELETL
ncbi:MAG: hypothetical protein WC107_07390 [Patescibacteria group bacterium]